MISMFCPRFLGDFCWAKNMADRLRRCDPAWALSRRFFEGCFEGCFDYHLWNIYGISMEYLWNIYGISMEYLWSIWVNLITTSPRPDWESLVNKGNHPQMAARFRLVIYSNLPRCFEGGFDYHASGNDYPPAIQRGH